MNRYDDNIMAALLALALLTLLIAGIASVIMDGAANELCRSIGYGSGQHMFFTGDRYCYPFAEPCKIEQCSSLRGVP